jgi:hypothetical protein
MPDSSLVVLIIDPDLAAAEELAALLADRPERPEVMASTSVLAAENALRTGEMDWLFIRLEVWADYEKLAASLDRPPRKIVFVSGRDKKIPWKFTELLDAHLKYPYSAEGVEEVWERLSEGSC